MAYRLAAKGGMPMSILTRPAVIQPQETYTFSDYFKLNPPVDELVGYFGYRHQVQYYQLPKTLIDGAFFACFSKNSIRFCFMLI